jgi:hypothetical protein
MNGPFISVFEMKGPFISVLGVVCGLLVGAAGWVGCGVKGSFLAVFGRKSPFIAVLA